MRVQDIPNTDDLDEHREEWARYADEQAAHYERSIAGIVQRTTVPEPQLSLLKAAHWRIIAKVIRGESP